MGLACGRQDVFWQSCFRCCLKALKSQTGARYSLASNAFLSHPPALAETTGIVHATKTKCALSSICSDHLRKHSSKALTKKMHAVICKASQPARAKAYRLVSHMLMRMHLIFSQRCWRLIQQREFVSMRLLSIRFSQDGEIKLWKRLRPCVCHSILMIRCVPSMKAT